MIAVMSFVVIRRFSVQRQVEARRFRLLVDPHSDGLLQHQHDGQCDTERPGNGSTVGQRLLEQQLDVAAVEDALHERAPEELGVGEEPDEQRTHEAAHEVHPDHVEGIVVPELGLQAYRIAADDPRDETDPDGRRT